MTKKADLKKLQKNATGLIQDYQAVFDSEAGRRVLLDLLDKGHILKPTNSVQFNPTEALLNEGKREMVLYIVGQMKKDVKYIMEMIAVNVKEKAREEESFY